MTTGVFSARQPQVALITAGAIALQGIAGLGFSAAYGFNVSQYADLGVLLGQGSSTAATFRWALLADMLGYLAVAPLVIYLHTRLQSISAGPGSRSWLISVGTFFGLAFSLVGAIGAAFFAAAGSALVELGTSGDATANAAFAAVARGVDDGLWGPLEFLCLGTWTTTIGWLLRVSDRRFGAASLLVGAGTIVYAARTGLSGRNPVALTEPIDVVALSGLALFALWEAWVAARLWLGR